MAKVLDGSVDPHTFAQLGLQAAAQQQQPAEHFQVHMTPNAAVNSGSQQPIFTGSASQLQQPVGQASNSAHMWVHFLSVKRCFNSNPIWHQQQPIIECDQQKHPRRCRPVSARSVLSDIHASYRISSSRSPVVLV
jgi:hypothetical protein